MKYITTLVLLFVISFSTLHEYTYAIYDTQHCSAQEYVDEFSLPSAHDDICDTHFEYHHSYLLPEIVSSFEKEKLNLKRVSLHDSYQFHNSLEFFKPPIV